MKNKQFYKRHFATAQDFKNWVIRLQTAYAMSFSPQHDSYELEKLHKAFGTCDPEKLVEIIYK